MLPSSHSVLIHEGPELLVDQGASGSFESNSHCNVAADRSPANIQNILRGAFSEFVTASSRLERSYRSLQDEVSSLRQELSRSSAALEQSRIQNRRMQLDLNRIVESMPCGVVVANAHGAITLMNREGLRLLHGGRNTPAPRTMHELSATLGVSLEALAASHPGSDPVCEVVNRAGNQERWIEVRKRVRQNEDHEDGELLILRDVTARKLAEGKREEGRRAMALAEVSADIAHEIRNPLASLELFAGLLEEDSDNRDRWVSHLRAGVRSLSATVNNVLLMRAGHLSLVPLNLVQTMQSALEFARPLAEQADISLEWRPAIDDFPFLGNACALQQVALNLVLNAVRHTPAGGRLVVTVSMCEPGCEIEFLDSGEGFPAEYLDRVLQPGFSGRGDTTGRGLAVCQRVMSEHGGSIEAGNGMQGGARVRLRFSALMTGTE